ncbi:uncharacterized protein G2W53_015335 [Senna tora]|uniref:Uncharacterized protein n=1 Tax=Senna tora TaxID=362788 RepID=A0A834WVB4_9FABA|nr:uncharacterized protein G2W53_015335 [Senna tora]
MEEWIPDTTEKVQHPRPFDSLFSYLGHVEILGSMSSIVIMAFFLPEDAGSVSFEPSKEWCHPYLLQPWVHESPVAQNLEELGSSHLGSGSLRVVPTWSWGLFTCCNIGAAKAGLKSIVWMLEPLRLPKEVT